MGAQTSLKSKMSAAKQVFGVVAFVAFLGSSAYGLNNVQSVEVYVPDCNDCGMTFLGRIELQICGHNGTEPYCCSTGILDDPSQDDFNAGTISKFSGDLLFGCNHFDLKNTTPNNMSMRIQHHGSDAGKFSMVKCITESKVYECAFKRFLDNEDFEVSTDCKYEA